MSENGSFIVIEGLIGVGKTSLCRLLEAKRNAELVLEPADDNHLAHFYSDSERSVFQHRCSTGITPQQQNNLRQNRLFANLLVADYLFEKDRLFAEQTLVGHEMELYDNFLSCSQTISSQIYRL